MKNACEFIGSIGENQFIFIQDNKKIKIKMLPSPHSTIMCRLNCFVPVGFNGWEEVPVSGPNPNFPGLIRLFIYCKF